MSQKEEAIQIEGTVVVSVDGGPSVTLAVGTTSTLLDALRSFQDDAWSRFAERFRGPLFFATPASFSDPDQETGTCKLHASS